MCWNDDEDDDDDDFVAVAFVNVLMLIIMMAKMIFLPFVQTTKVVMSTHRIHKVSGWFLDNQDSEITGIVTKVFSCCIY